MLRAALLACSIAFLFTAASSSADEANPRPLAAAQVAPAPATASQASPSPVRGPQSLAGEAQSFGTVLAHHPKPPAPVKCGAGTNLCVCSWGSACAPRGMSCTTICRI